MVRVKSFPSTGEKSRQNSPRVWRPPRTITLTNRRGPWPKKNLASYKRLSLAASTAINSGQRGQRPNKTEIEILGEPRGSSPGFGDVSGCNWPCRRIKRSLARARTLACERGSGNGGGKVAAVQEKLKNVQIYECHVSRLVRYPRCSGRSFMPAETSFAAARTRWSEGRTTVDRILW